MPDCTNEKYVGKIVTVEYAIGCPDTIPASGDWKFIGSLRNKEITTEWDTIDATTDDSPGGARENLVSYQNFSITVDGLNRQSDDATHNQNALIDHITNPAATGGQPYAWVRITDPARTRVAPMIWTNATQTHAYDDVSTFSIEASLAPSAYGVQVTPTP